jgi:sister chromatid cohesion protein DCC1
MILVPSLTQPTTSVPEPFIPIPNLTAISKIEDTIELIEQVEVQAPVKKGKWHEKFARTRGEGK